MVNIPRSPGLGGRRRQATQLDIAEAAATLFDQQGYEATTVEQIATLAGVSLSTFYRYCVAKDDVMTSILARGVHDLVAAMEAQPRERPFVESVVDSYMEPIDHDPHIDLRRRLALVMLTTPALKMRWLAAERSAQENLIPVVSTRFHLPESSLVAEVVSALIISAVTSALEHSLRNDKPLRECVRTSVELIGLGIVRLTGGDAG